jgi:hypothetical protein
VPSRACGCYWPASKRRATTTGLSSSLMLLGFIPFADLIYSLNRGTPPTQALTLSEAVFPSDRYIRFWFFDNSNIHKCRGDLPIPADMNVGWGGDQRIMVFHWFPFFFASNYVVPFCFILGVDCALKAVWVSPSRLQVRPRFFWHWLRQC